MQGQVKIREQDEILMYDFIELQKERVGGKSVQQYNETPTKHRYVLAEDQAKLVDVITKVSNPAESY
jgi:hypothetical protein